MQRLHRPSLTLRLLLTSAVLLATAASVYTQTPAQPLNPELDPAIKLMREGETEKALKSLKRVVKNNKLDGEAWYYLGVVYLQLSDFKKAADAFKKDRKSTRLNSSHLVTSYAVFCLTKK